MTFLVIVGLQASDIGDAEYKWNIVLRNSEQNMKPWTQSDTDRGGRRGQGNSISNIKVLELIAGEFQLSKIKTYEGWEEYACKT